MDSKNESLFTQIPNELMEILMSNALSRNEIRVLLLIARKTYGFHKKSDQISLTQFQEKLGLSRQGVVSILKRLELVNICRQVHKGNSRLASSEWLIDTTNYPEKLVKLSGLVKFTPKNWSIYVDTQKKRQNKKRSSSLDNSVVDDKLTPEQYHNLMRDAEDLSRVVVERKRR